MLGLLQTKQQRGLRTAKCICNSFSKVHVLICWILFTYKWEINVHLLSRSAGLGLTTSLFYLSRLKDFIVVKNVSRKLAEETFGALTSPGFHDLRKKLEGSRGA